MVDVKPETGYIGSLEVPRETLHLLAATGYVEGTDEMGWTWTKAGRLWITGLVSSAALGLWR